MPIDGINTNLFLTLQDFCIIEYQCGTKVLEIISLAQASPNTEKRIQNPIEIILKRWQ
jgi:hypothetical protein